MLTRYLDAEQYEKANLQVELCNFLARVQTLFVQKKCWGLETSYSRLMLEFVLQPRTFFLGGERRTIGGPDSVSRSLMDKCVQRLINWTVLARDVIEGEFPEFELMQSFAVCNLSSRKLYKHEESGKVLSQHYSRLAKFLGVPRDQLVRELEDTRGRNVPCQTLFWLFPCRPCQCQDHKPIAERIFSSSRCTMMEAWSQAVRESREDARRSAQHPSFCLGKLLERYGAYTGSTSGVERMFATAHRAAGLWRKMSSLQV